MSNGYAFALGPCFACGKTFSFNPLRVPSFRDNHGVRCPVCSECMTIVNVKRKEKGLDPFDIPSDAYEPVAEGELPT